jgi:RNA polymerase sigma factor (sigma-70 family)
MPNDIELLKSYVEKGSESAFAELVRRHVNLVYSAALREIHGDRGLAEDVTQAVFHELARKASRLIRHPVLSGWLYTSVRLFAANVRRSEQRRQRREQEASAMSEPTEKESPESVWRQVRPALDDAMHELSETDRATVVLRFFEGHNLSEIGQTLGLRENAARMRVDRALAKLRALLAKRGITSTASGLAAALALGAVLPAPSALAAAVTASAVASVASTSALTTTIQIITMNKATVGVVSVLLAASAGIPLWQQSRLEKLQSQNEALQAQVQQIPSLQKEIVQLKQKQAVVSSPAPMGDKHQAEQMKLRGLAGNALRALQEADRLRNQLAKQENDNAATDQELGRRIERMKAKLNLTSDQEAAIRDIMMAQAKLASEAMQMVFSGKVDKDKMDKLEEATGNPEQKIKALLTPGQQAAYQDYQNEEILTRARTEVSSEFTQLQAVLGLSREQEGPVYDAIYQQTMAMIDPVTANKLSSDAEQSRLQSSMDQRLAALEQVLSAEQLAKYRQQQEMQNRLREARSFLLNMGFEKH